MVAVVYAWVILSLPDAIVAMGVTKGLGLLHRTMIISIISIGNENACEKRKLVEESLLFLILPSEVIDKQSLPDYLCPFIYLLAIRMADPQLVKVKDRTTKGEVGIFRGKMLNLA
jgi:hypothetical protein